MRRRRTTWAVLLLVLVLGACSQAQPVTEVAQSRWIEARTENFVVVTNAGDARARKMVNDLEEFRRFAITALNIDVAETPLPFTIYAVTSDADLQSLVETARAFGVFQSSYRGGLAVVNINARGADGTDRVQVIPTLSGPRLRVTANQRGIGMDGVFHEYVHYLQALNPDQRFPLWFSEGFADYLSTFHVTPDGRYRVGDAPRHRVSELKAGISDPRARKSGDPRFRWIPFDALINARGYDTGHGQGPFYGQSWLLTHHLLSDPDRTALLDQYLEASNTPSLDSVPLFEETFGLNMSQLYSRLRQYLRSDRFASQTFDRPDAPLPEPTITEVAPDQIRTQLGYALLHFTPSFEKAETLLNDALAINPANIEAKALLAALAFAAEDDARVEALIRDAGDAADTNIEFLTLKGHHGVRKAVQLYEAGDESWRTAVVEARLHFRNAISLGVQSAEPFIALGRSYLLSDTMPPEEALELIGTARTLLPSSLETRLILGHLQFRRGEVGAAQANYEHVLAWSRNPQSRTRAREMLERIQAILAEVGESQQGVNPVP